MSEQNRNRFQLEDDTPMPSGDAFVYDTPDEPAQAAPVYLDEPDPRYKKRMQFKLFLWLGLVLVALGTTAGVYFGFFHNKQGDIAGTTKSKFDSGLDGPRERYYIPKTDFSPRLRRAVGLHKGGEYNQARREIENIIKNSRDDREKVAALVYRAVMHLRAGQLYPARFNLQKALQKDPENVAALVNMSIVTSREGNMKGARDYAVRARRLAPNDARISILLGNILARGGDPAAAVNSYNNAIKNTQGDPVPHFNKAVALYRQKKFEEAVLSFNQAIKDSNETGRIAVQSYAYLAQINFHGQRYAAAADYLRKATALAPGDGRHFYNLGIAYLRLKQQRQAMIAFRRALAAGSNEPRVMRGLARALDDLNEPKRAIEALRKHLVINGEDVAALFHLGDLLYRENELMAAAEQFRRIVNITPGDKNTQDALVKLGAVYADLERYRESVLMLRKALELNNRNTRAWYSLGMAYKRSGKTSEAMAAWREALKLSGDGGMSRDDERRIRMSMGAAFRDEGAYQLAVRQYRMILDLNQRAPQRGMDAPVELELGKTYMQLKDRTRAIQTLRRVAETSAPIEVDLRRRAFLHLASAYAAGNASELQTAREYAYKAARLGKGDSETLLVQASILLRTESVTDRERAVEILRALTAGDIDSASASKANNLLGLAYYKNGEYSRALGAFDRAVDLDPTNRSARDNQRLASNAMERNRR